ncbi:DUF3159 domain-containing protein [Phytoactinopolyspora limicola]|uniref:DUF3159 domain-containing protein n=1 Tax=Phytoactinopolyspora limicola TaxID=2715536 RepID=UPI001407AF3A|nr:DUF3159 domain-containing protein [Phytoactinopolyspora limicola]
MSPDQPRAGGAAEGSRPTGDSRPEDLSTEAELGHQAGAAGPSGSPEHLPPRPRGGWMASLASDDRFAAKNALTPGALLDAGLPLALFTAVYTIGGRDLTLSLWAALGTGALLAVIRLVRREPMQSVIAGFLGVGVAVFWASRTGRAEDVFLPGLLINVGYGLAFLVSIVVRWPLVGILVGLATGMGTSWRRDPVLMKALMKASALWVGMFAFRLAVQAPLYFAGEEQLGWLASARLAMGAPLFLLVAYVSWLIIRPAFRAHQQRASVAGQQEEIPTGQRQPGGHEAASPDHDPSAGTSGSDPHR